MLQKWTRSMLLLMLVFSLFAQGAMAESRKAAKTHGKYRQVTGKVVSIGSDSIVIKSRSKGEMKLAITKNTDMIGQPVKTGDKATVNYRVDNDTNTATRIAAKTASKRTSAKRRETAPAAAASR